MKTPADSHQANAIPRVLPRGRYELDPQLVAASQRQRLLEAITALVAERGYPDVTIRDIVTRAGTAKRTSYDHFADKSTASSTSMVRTACSRSATTWSRWRSRS